MTDQEDKPLISIVTVVHNRVDTLGRTIASMATQSYRHVEFIVVDGGSTDGTLDLIRSAPAITKWVSEPDGGIYDAMNKGLAMCRGEIIGFLNSDDLYADDSVLSAVADCFQQQQTDAVYGNLVYCVKGNAQDIVRTWIAGPYHRTRFLEGWMPPHPAFFVKKKCFEAYGHFVTGLTQAADYELMLRFLYKHHVTAAYLNKVLVLMSEGGISNASLRNRIRANIQDRQAWHINELKPRWYTIYLKPISKIPQFFARLRRRVRLYLG